MTLYDDALQLLFAGRIAAAEAGLAQVVAADPTNVWAKIHYGRLLVLRGEYERGFALLDHRAGLPYFFKRLSDALGKQLFTAKAWDGQPMDGTLVVVGEQGLGDMLLTARFLPWAAARCRRLVFASHLPDLGNILRSAAPDIEVMSPDEACMVEADAFCLAMSLFRLAKPTPETIGAPPCFRADPQTVAGWRAHFAARPGRNVGLCWTSISQVPWVAQRSVPLAAFRPLLEQPGVNFHALQLFVPDAAAEGLDPALMPHDMSVRLGGDPMQTLAAMAALDLVVTIDTSVTYFAGGLGVPGWLLVPTVPGWAFGSEGETVPWYPSLRAFRATPEQGFAPALAEMEQAFGRWLSGTAT